MPARLLALPSLLELRVALEGVTGGPPAMKRDASMCERGVCEVRVALEGVTGGPPANERR